MGRGRRQRRRRVAALGGAAIVAKKHHDKKEAAQQEQAPAEDAQPADTGTDEAAPAPQAGAMTPETLDELKELGELHEQHVLTDEEFESQNAKLLGSA